MTEDILVFSKKQANYYPILIPPITIIVHCAELKPVLRIGKLAHFIIVELVYIVAF